MEPCEYDSANALNQYKLLFDQARNNQGMVNFSRLNITAHVDMKTLPYIHYSDQKKLDSRIYTIQEKGHEVNGNRMIEYAYAKPDSAELDLVIGSMAEAMAFYDTFQVRAAYPTKSIDDKINGFLKRRTGKEYNDLLGSVDMQALSEEDFAKVAKMGLKKKIFNYRARIYLASLASADEAGYDIDSLLDELSKTIISPIKRTLNEPTFERIKAYLRNNP